jgi:putative SOS response-associated peptidase YedK
MCGRFSLTVNEAELNERFRLAAGSTPYVPRYNCAPTQLLAVVTNENPQQLSYLKWGLIPSWAKDSAIGNKMINARAETILEKSSYKTPFKRRRCLVPSDGFYEWKINGDKVPYRIYLKNTKLFAFAGLWERWHAPNGEITDSFTIITTAANHFMKPIHERMPVILKREDEKQWLENDDLTLLTGLLKPFDPAEMNAYPVSKLINSPRNESPLVLERAGLDNNTLFSGL